MNIIKLLVEVDILRLKKNNRSHPNHHLCQTNMHKYFNEDKGVVVLISTISHQRQEWLNSKHIIIDSQVAQTRLIPLWTQICSRTIWSSIFDWWNNWVNKRIYNDVVIMMVVTYNECRLLTLARLWCVLMIFDGYINRNW